MTIRIAPQMLLTDIKTEFNTRFPYLKLAFFSKAHAVGKSNSARELLSDPKLTVAALNPDLKEELTFLFGEETTVNELEQGLETKAGLHVQVFRKSGSIWLETSVTDNLTLAKQTELAKQSQWHETPIADPMDYREQD